ncbi:pyrroloquinoline quinone biosynthesis peptide chaperone PqqD [Streptomyces sp. AS02]|uniref:pyrroloquinoline quinone biosynthesis peptide chaperone PqqD n=1 Tax=Streptomyces sp. AS02 TaxID=2938946 RepID=UPI0020221DDF|nr:pyrroloquinoline quinone biosynthesis peptide chaperone PqqD [Streptomyces sp. AS02]MCL8014893.1 pyrroloquinoline quinone biosynthesis peptide chaperone PqqD [Streptomyces sp. AS02]
MNSPAPETTPVTYDAAWCPRLRPGVMLRHDPVRGADLLLMPERVVVLKGRAAAVLRYCDGATPLHAVLERLAADFPGAPVTDEVPAFLARIRETGWLR